MGRLGRARWTTAIVSAALVMTTVIGPPPARGSLAALIFAAELVGPTGPTTDHVILVFDGALDPFSIPDGTDFTIDADGVVQPATAVSLPYAMYGGLLSVLRLDLATPIGTGGTVDYSPGAHPLRTAGVPLDPIVDFPLDILFGSAFEHLVTIVDEGLGRSHALSIWTRPIGLGPLPDPGDFVLTVTPSGGSPTAHSAVSIAIVEPFYGVGLLDLGLPVELAADDSATIDYTPGTTPLLDVASTAAVAFTGGTVAVNLAPTSTRATAPGPDVAVAPADRRTGTQPVTLTFDTVTAGGETTLTTDTTGPDLPTGFQLGDPPDYFEISTTASFSGAIEVCISYDETAYDPPETSIRLLHFEAGAWSDVTASLDTATNIVCGVTTSLSPFALATLQPFPFTGFFAPVDAEPVVNVLKAGASVPLKFDLRGDRGLGILAAGSPSSVGTACPTAATFDVVEAPTTSASGLHYDTATGHYTYVWKSQKAWAGTCREFRLRLTDGSLHTASFRFS